MNLMNRFSRWLLGFNKKEFTLKEGLCLTLGIETMYKNLAIDTCVNLIAGSLLRAELKTFEKGEEVKRDSYYLFNVESNVNQSAADFMNELVSKLVYENECLVVMLDKQLLIADSWNKKSFVVKENVYTDVIVDDLKLNKDFYESDVFYFRLNNNRISDVIDGLYNDYGKILKSTMDHYKRKNAMRLLVHMDTLRSQTDEAQEYIEDLFDEQLKNFFEAEGGAALPLQDGLAVEEIFNEKSTGSTGSDTRDIRAVIDDVFDFVAMAFHIPKGLLKGDLAEVESQTDNYLMFCLAPIAEIIEDEINRKYYTKKEYLARTYLRVDTSMLKYVDIVKFASALDKLLSSGTHSLNENRMAIGKEPVREEWADKHYITKNYAEAEGYLEGGDQN